MEFSYFYYNYIQFSLIFTDVPDMWLWVEIKELYPNQQDDALSNKKITENEEAKTTEKRNVSTDEFFKRIKNIELHCLTKSLPPSDIKWYINTTKVINGTTEHFK